MKTSQRIGWSVLSAAVVLLAGNGRALAQGTPNTRVVQQVDDQKTVRLQGNVHPFTRIQNDAGAVADAQPMQRMLLLLQRSAAQETALRQLLDAQQTKSSGSYHAWLTPQQFGTQFGPSDADVQAVTDWLTRQGFQVAKVAAGRTAIEFSGNVGQVRNAFHTEIHRFAANGEEHFANVSDPAIPEALAPVVSGVVALNNYPKQSHAKVVGAFQRDLATGQIRPVKPLFTYTDLNGTFYGVGPADFAKIYNIPAGATGAGQSVAIVGQSNINIQDVRDFRSLFGLPAKDPQIIVNGPDPGLVSGDEGESDLDVEWSGAVAPAAQIVFVTSQSTMSNPTQVTAGIDLSALYIIDNNVAPVMSESYGSCEASLGATGNAFYNAMWQQAAAQGITVAISSGDTGSAACDPAAPPANPNAAALGIAVNGIGSTPYNVIVGGTDFNQTPSTLSTYWNSTNAATTQLSALGYIPETVWNDSACAAMTPVPTTCASVDPNQGDISAGGGGPSNCATGSGTSCVGYPKPAFQTGITPADSVRDVPDVSFFASNGQNFSFYIVCQSDQNPNNAPCDLTTSATSGTHNFLGVGGTSGSTPSFAGIMALVNQSEVTAGRSGRQGNANFVLYALAAKETFASCNSSSFTPPGTPIPPSCVFNDITKGNNAVACVAGTANCSNTTSSGYGLLTVATGADASNPAFNAGQGYDLATGLGSINVANLLSAWGTAGRTATTTTLGAPSATTLTSGQAFSIPVTVTSSSGTPTGSVSLVAITAAGQQGFGPFTLSSGKAMASTNLLPPGTTSIEAIYGGDATHATSTSAAAAVAVGGSGQASTVTLSFVTFDTNNNPVLSTASQNVSYGSPYILQIAVTHGGTPCTSNGTLTTPGTPCPTGTVSLTDNGNPLMDYPNGPTSNATATAKLNNQGIAEDQPIQLAPGSHSIVAAYAGDPNYTAANSNTLAVTITKATTTTAVGSSLTSITAGTMVKLTAYEVTTSNGAGPTGTIQFSNGSTSLGAAVTCAPTSGAANTTVPAGTPIQAGTAYCVATITTAISALYPPPTAEPGTPWMPAVPLAIVALCAALYLVGMRWMPEQRRRAYAYAGLLGFALLAAGIAGCGGSSNTSGGGGSSGSGPGTRTINAVYSGDTNYAASNGSISITITK